MSQNLRSQKYMYFIKTQSTMKSLKVYSKVIKTYMSNYISKNSMFILNTRTVFLGMK